VRARDLQGAIDTLQSAKTYYGVKIGLLIAGFCFLMVSLPVGALLFGWWRAGFIGSNDPGGGAPSGIDEVRATLRPFMTWSVLSPALLGFAASGAPSSEK